MALAKDASQFAKIIDWNELPKIGIGWEVGMRHGWGIHGYHLARRMIERALAVPMLSLVDKHMPKEVLDTLLVPVRTRDGESFPMIYSAGLAPSKFLAHPAKGDAVIAVFESDLTPNDLARIREFGWRCLCVSKWNTEYLKAAGIPAQYAPIGVDTDMFQPRTRGADFKSLWGDNFVIFSGGKAELRKGQDIVLKAFKIFNTRHPDSLLVTMWHNHWPETARSLLASPYTVGLPYTSGPDGSERIEAAWITNNGVPPHARVAYNHVGREDLVHIIANCDVALFPNRCEGGTNMVAMECLAAGLPTILSRGHGHDDLIKFPVPCYALDHQKRCTLPGATDQWVEPDIDEIVEGLEHIYNNRGEARSTAINAATTMQTAWTWDIRMDAQIDLLGIGVDTSVLDKAIEASRQTVINTQTNEQARQFAALAGDRQNKGKFKAAAAIARRAKAMAEDDMDILGQLSNIMLTAHKPGAALAYCNQVAKKRPDLGKLIAHNRGLAHLYMGEIKQAIAEFRKEAPNSVECATDLAYALLTAGQWDEGFKAMEVRRLHRPDKYLKHSMPEWDGEDISNKVLWVTCEQGIGDCFQFARFLPWARSQCKWLILSAHATTMAMFCDYPGVGDLRQLNLLMPEPQADVHTPLMSLARFYGASPTNLPDDPWHFAEVAKRMPAKLDGTHGRFKIGLVWAGSAIHARDWERSIPLEALLPIIEIPGTQLFSFQVGPHAADLAELGIENVVADLSPQLADWPLTAAALTQLDLLVTCDTAIAHLAGALRIPTCLLLCKLADWRWLTKRKDTPWYPTVDLYRQHALGNWDVPVAHVCARIESMIKKL